MQNEVAIGVQPSRPSAINGRLSVLRPILLTAVVIAAGPLLGCESDGSATAQPPLNDIPAVLATIGSEQITTADLRAHAGPELDRIETQYLIARSKLVQNALESILRERLFTAEAQRKGKTVEELLTAEAAPGGLEPSEVEIAAWYNENQARFGGRTLQQLRPQIWEYLREQRETAAVQRLEQRLHREQSVSVSYRPYRLEFDNTAAPSLGPASAPVSVVEFSDFQCPFCQRFAPTLKRLRDEFGDSVQVVYRQFPIPSLHANAFKASEASLCAHEQGKFWELHDLMFAEQGRLAVADLKEKARRVELNTTRFDTCLDAGRYVEQVQKDMQEGQRAGVNGTPAVFVNGVLLEGGAVPYATVAAAVRRELSAINATR